MKKVLVIFLLFLSFICGYHLSSKNQSRKVIIFQQNEDEKKLMDEFLKRIKITIKKENVHNGVIYTVTY